MKKITVLMLIIFLFSNCLILKISKDSKPLVDFGIPLAGHFRNGENLKGFLYTVIFSASIISIILLSPSQTSESVNARSIITADRQISDPLFFSMIGSAAAVLTASSLDTAITYHYVNDKIIRLNGLAIDRDNKFTKYEFINDFRKKQSAEKSSDEEIYKNEIAYYRKKLLDATVTDEELVFIKTNKILSRNLEKEMGAYYINKEIKNNGAKQ